MKMNMILMLLGGLALFLYGMQMMSNNLEAVAGDRMKSILERLTANRFLGVIVGAGITAVIQSSSATTVMVVGFVNSGLMTLNQAVWIIMGANIGTTITGQLIALDIGTIAPLIAFIGVAMILFVKNKKVQYVGGIVAGLGVLFIGMGMMSDAMIPLRDSKQFIELMTQFSNPFLGILAGAGFTAIIQSSSASVGILQALAMSGLISINSAVFVLFGQNIGTCITAVLASIGTSRNAKRTTIIHLMFNLIGTVIFVCICLTVPFAEWIALRTPDNLAAQIANVHTIFNIATTLILIPFGDWLAKVATIILPDKKEETSDTDKWFDELSSSQHVLGISTIAINNLKEEMNEMLSLTYENIENGFKAIEQGNPELLREVSKKEEAIDMYNVKLSRKIAKILTIEKAPDSIKEVKSMFEVIGNIERIGDHAMNLAEYAVTMQEKGLKLSKDAHKEIKEMRHICLDTFTRIKNISEGNKQQVLGEVTVLEQRIDDTTEEYRKRQTQQIQEGICDIETSIYYTEILTDYERIGDHMLNIAEAYAGIK
ncbi:Na/Pi cotransporter family protein [Velocimicrobium porci]|uniref:Na/Pi cotransporter family protein n=1 Tax=Velocimicrobium porci TaxID=2606634 RepID=A0A6L5XXM9_9FIRM|nr:Na/Pi cotransporter family protein [Velocimicrobium porci]MSS63626.1 Na/Pi cotransporter family protein [Velocimicrobium porci]